MFPRHSQIVVLERVKISHNRLVNMDGGLLPALAPRNTTREAGTLGYPRAIFAWINDYLSHK